MTLFETDPAQAHRSGIIACVVTAVAGLICAGVAALVPPTILTFVLIVAAVAAFAGVVWLAYQTRGLNNISYSLDRNSFVIRSGGAIEIIPMAEVQRVFPAADIADGLRVRRLPLAGWWVCAGSHPALGKIRFYANAPLDFQSIVVTPDVSFAVSPYDVDVFDESFETRLAMRPTQEVRYSKLTPGLRSNPLWNDRLARVLTASGLVAFLGLLAVAFAVFPALPRTLPLHYSGLGIADRYGPASSVFGLALFAFCAWAANTVIGGLLFRANERLAGYLAWGAGILVQLFFGAAFISIIGAALG